MQTMQTKQAKAASQPALTKPPMTKSEKKQFQLNTTKYNGICFPTHQLGVYQKVSMIAIFFPPGTGFAAFPSG
jgi:hypothetical protein